MQTILVLEDDTELNQTICFSLEREGYRVLSAGSCGEARELAEKNTLALAILDVNLPDGDGFEFCKWIRARNQSAVLFLSARDLEIFLLAPMSNRATFSPCPDSSVTSAGLGSLTPFS